MSFLIVKLFCKSTLWTEEYQENIIQDGCFPEEIRTFRLLNARLELIATIYNKFFLSK